MRQIKQFFLLLLVLALPLIGQAQSLSPNYIPVYIAGTAVGDTLVNADTNYYYISNNNQWRSNLVAIVRILPVVSTTAGNIHLQIGAPLSAKTSNANTIWHTVTTTAIASGTLTYLFNYDLIATRARFMITSTATRTQAVRIQAGLRRSTAQ